jgi:hypothetical protein
MNKYQLSLDHLGELESFDPLAFIADDVFSQDVCDLVLALAIAYNDYKDLILGHQILQGLYDELEDLTTPTRELGQGSGISIHLYRLLAGFLHELYELIASSSSVVNSVGFQRVLKVLPAAARDAWRDLVEAVDAAGPKGSALGRMMFFARNKVSFHYDRKEIGRAYRERFTTPPGQVPYISRGTAMANARFYFADAAGEAYLRLSADEATAKEFFTAGFPLLHQVNHALREIVTRFVTARGFAWRRAAAT